MYNLLDKFIMDNIVLYNKTQDCDEIVRNAILFSNLYEIDAKILIQFIVDNLFCFILLLYLNE